MYDFHSFSNIFLDFERPYLENYKSYELKNGIYTAGNLILRTLEKTACRYDFPFRRYGRFIAACHILTFEAAKLRNLVTVKWVIDARFLKKIQLLPEGRGGGDLP